MGKYKPKQAGISLKFVAMWQEDMDTISPGNFWLDLFPPPVWLGIATDGPEVIGTPDLGTTKAHHNGVLTNLL